MKKIFSTVPIFFFLATLLISCAGKDSSRIASSPPVAIAPSKPPLEQGREIYGSNCSGCHGVEGDGESIIAEILEVPPRSFEDGLYKYKTTKGEGMPHDDDLLRIIQEGIPGTAMPPWEEKLSAEEIKNVVLYIKTFAPHMFEEFKGEKIAFNEAFSSTAESIEKGRDIFLKKAQCNECHGDRGKGDGIKVLKHELTGVRLWPRNLTQPWTFGGGARKEDIFARISTGIAGTPMPAFSEGPKGLTQEERWHVTNYVLSLADWSKKPNPDQKNLQSPFTKTLPRSVSDPQWKAVKGLIAPMRIKAFTDKTMFFPARLSLIVKSLYDGDSIAFLFEWDDRTPSRLGDDKVAALSEGGELYPDSLAVKFLPPSSQLTLRESFRGHNQKDVPANILYWKAPAIGGVDQVRLLHTAQFGFWRESSSPEEKAILVDSLYRLGTWKVLLVVKRKDLRPGNTLFGEFQPIPLSLALWDGSNQEKGERHTITPWYRFFIGGDLSDQNRVPNSLPVEVTREDIFHILSYGLLNGFFRQGSHHQKEAYRLYKKPLSQWSAQDLDLAEGLAAKVEEY